MVARRLIAVLVVMLVLSSLLAGLTQTGTSPTSTTTTTSKGAGGHHQARTRLVHASLDASASHPRTIRLRTGDQIALRVHSTKPDQVEVRGFGEVSAIDRFSPAIFNLLATTPGRYAVHLLDADRTIGTLAVRPQPRSNKRPEKAGSGGA